MRTVSRTAVPALTTEQMRAVDHVMVEDLHIELVQMMENAGRSLAELAIIRFSPGSLTILAGPGGNGGGGLVAARHLANRGCQVQVVLTEPDRLTPVPAHQADILARMGVTIASRPATADLIIDAMIGYSLRRPRRRRRTTHHLGQRPSRPGAGPGHPQRPRPDHRDGCHSRRLGRSHPYVGPAQGWPARRAERRGTLPSRHLGAAAGLSADGDSRPRVVPPGQPAPDRLMAIQPARPAVMTGDARATAARSAQVGSACRGTEVIEDALSVVPFPGFAGLAGGVVLVEADEQISQLTADGLGTQ